MAGANNDQEPIQVETKLEKLDVILSRKCLYIETNHFELNLSIYCGEYAKTKYQAKAMKLVAVSRVKNPKLQA